MLQTRLNTAEGLNQGCFCRTLNAELLREQLEIDPGLAGLAQSIALALEML